MQMNLNTDLSEKVAYDTSSLPVYIRRAYLSDYPNYSAVSHWHDDVEFILVLSGHMLYNVNGEISLIKEGEGIFVNTRQLHYGFSDDYSECHFICLILHPVTLCASNLIAQKYIHPVLDNKSQPYLVLHPDSANAKIILESIKDLYSCKTSETPELLTQSLLYRLWSSLFLLAGSQPPNPLPGNDRLIALKNMISYIETHHREKITLSQISAAGNAGKTTCCTIFQKYVNLYIPMT